MKREITGGVVQLDEQDLPLFEQYKWHVGDTGYAVWRGIVDGKKQTVRLHRLIMQPPAGLVVDHRNHDKLDNRRENLRVVTQSENMRNKTNQGKGYWYQRKNQNWVVEVNGKHVCCVDTELEARKIVALVRMGGVYEKPVLLEPTECKWGHTLADAYEYNDGKHCRTCQSQRSRAYFRRSYVPRPRPEVIFCVRGHDRRLTKTAKGDCSECIIIRAKQYRGRKVNGR